jgi:hypothetical protein
MHRAERSGKKKFISLGASVPGVSWKSILTPSTTSRCPVFVTYSVGRTSETVPVLVVCPRPAPTWPAGPLASAAPYMYPARRAMAVPA